jgi:transposase
MAFVGSGDHASGMAIARLRANPHAQCEAVANELREQIAGLDEKIEKLVTGMRAQEKMFNHTVQKLEKDKADLQEKLDDANKSLSWFRRTYFGQKGEKLDPEAVSEEEETGTERKAEEAKESASRPKGQQRGSKGHGPTDRSGVPIGEEIEIEIAGGCKCTKCGKAYKALAETDNSSLLEMVIFLHLVKYSRVRYAPQCSCAGNKIETAPPPARLYPRTTVGNSLWLWLVVQKYLFGVPTNRSLKALALEGLSLSPGTVAGGFMVIEKLIDSLYEQIKDHCRGADQWNGDETTWRVFDADKTKWWLWVMASHDAVVYILDQSRSAAVPSKFFAGSVGVLVTDRLASYKSLCEAIRKAWCWVHQRRDFHKIFDGMPKCRDWAKDWLLEITELFVRNDVRCKLWKDGRMNTKAWRDAQQSLEEQIAKLRTKWEEQLRLPELHKHQKTALNSLKRHWEGLTLFVSDVKIPMENNRAERLLRQSVILRKGSYGSGSTWAGNLTAKILTIFHTWLVNRLDPQALFLDFLNECSKTPGKPPPDLSNFLPWKMSDGRKQDFALPSSYKPPG